LIAVPAHFDCGPLHLPTALTPGERINTTVGSRLTVHGQTLIEIIAERASKIIGAA
jgi:hypothetical protein